MFDASNVTTDALVDFDSMMIECAIKVEKVAPLALSLWSDILKELDRRGKVQLVSGSYDDIGNAAIVRL
jgi:hypothetical protein